MNHISSQRFRLTSNLYQVSSCVICQYYIKRRDKVMELACGHIFHTKCAKSLEDCAICRTPLDTTRWLNKGNYKEESEKYLQMLAEEAEDDPVQQVGQIDAVYQNLRRTRCFRWMIISLVACISLGIIIVSF